MHPLLILALKSDDITSIKSYLNEVPSNQSTYDETLYQACKNGCFAIAKYLIQEKKANPNTMIHNVWKLDNGPVLKFAAESGNLDLVKYLIEDCKVDMEARGEYPGTQDTALSRAANEGHIEIVRYLLNKGANPYCTISYGTILGEAVNSGKIDVVKTLVSAGVPITPHELHYAIEQGHLEIVKYFVEQGVNLFKSYIDPYTNVAAKSGNVELLKFLLDKGLSILEKPIFSSHDPQYDILSAAAEGGSVEMMRYLVETHKLDLVKYITNDNSNKYAYKYDGYSTILGKAVAQRMSSHKPKGYNLPLLQYLFDELKLIPPKKAFARLKKKEAKFSGINVNAYLQSFLVEDVDTKKILLAIADKGLDAVDIPMLFRLYESKLIQESSYNFFGEEISKRIDSLSLSKSEFEKLIKENKQFALDALFYYSQYQFNNDITKLKMILEMGVDVNLINEIGENAVQIAAKSGGYNNIVKYLLEKGADVDHANYAGDTLINILGRLMYSDLDKLMDVLKNSKDYTNSLKQACKNFFDNSLPYILKHSNGAIGSATIEELLASASDSGKIKELFTHVSPALTRDYTLMTPTYYIKSNPVKKIPQPKPSQSGLFASTDMKEIENWTGKKFGKFREFKKLENDIRILLHSGGFAIFFPKEVWHQFDVQVNNYLSVPTNGNAPCWIAGKDFTFTKIDVDKNELAKEDQDYASEDNKIAMDKVEQFVKRNFINNSQAFPDSDYFSIGSNLESGGFRPFRIRLGGNFNIKF